MRVHVNLLPFRGHRRSDGRPVSTSSVSSSGSHAGCHRIAIADAGAAQLSFQRYRPTLMVGEAPAAVAIRSCTAARGDGRGERSKTVAAVGDALMRPFRPAPPLFWLQSAAPLAPPPSRRNDPRR